MKSENHAVRELTDLEVSYVSGADTGFNAAAEGRTGSSERLNQAVKGFVSNAWNTVKGWFS